MGADENEKESNGTSELEPTTKEEESQLEKVPYPKSVFFIVSNEFCERFSFYGMRTILSLYLRDKLFFSESDSKIIYHTFTVFVYTFPLLGAIISDSWLGKFRTILYLSIVYACGNILLALSSAKSIGIPQVPFSLLSLLIIALGTGGIKPCVAAFGGDQFVLPQQAKQLVTFFSVFYFSINFGSFISSFLTPVLREDVECLGEKSCLPLAFGVPGILMVVSIIVFAVGKPMYREVKPKGNIMVQVCKCMWYAVKNKRKSEKKRDHWMDYAEDKFGAKLVNDIKITLKVIVLFIPLPVFWALYDQQGSGWTFQAARMNGDLGFYTILPDQMQVINAILILAFIPLFTYGVYPLFAKCNLLTTPLQKMACGGFLAAGAFAISVAVAFALEATFPVLPVGKEYQIRMYNPMHCPVTINAGSYIQDETIESLGYQKFTGKVDQTENVSYSLTFEDVCSENFPNKTGQFELKKATTTLLTLSSEGFLVFKDNINKPEDGLPAVRTLVSNIKEGQTVHYKGDGSLTVETNDTGLVSFQPGSYKLDDFPLLKFRMGGVYTVVVDLDNNGTIINATSFEVTTPNNIHMLLLIPQYVVLTAAEILFSITGLELSYSQAPKTMKSVLQALFLLTTAFGNLLIVIIESAKIFDKQSYDFLLYTGLMLLDMVLFAFLAYRYVYVTKEELEESSVVEQENEDENDDEKTRF